MSGVCWWSGVLWHGCKLCLGNCQLKRCRLASLLFGYFPSPFMFFFLLIFYFDILIYKNRYYLLADVCLLSSYFFSECRVSFFSFSLFSIGKVLQCLFTFFLYALFVCSAFVFPMKSVNLSDHLWCKFTLTFSFSDALKRKTCFSCVCFFSICASFAWVVGLFVPDIVCQCFT